MYWTGDSMNNLLSYCGLVDAKIRASDNYLPVYLSLFMSIQGTHFITQDLWYIFNNSNRVDGGTSQDQKFGRFLERFFELGWSIYNLGRLLVKISSLQAFG